MTFISGKLCVYLYPTDVVRIVKDRYDGLDNELLSSLKVSSRLRCYLLLF